MAKQVCENTRRCKRPMDWGLREFHTRKIQKEKWGERESSNHRPWSRKLLTNDFPRHEQQADGRGHIQLAAGPRIPGVVAAARTLLGVAVVIVLSGQFKGLQVQAGLGHRDPAGPVWPRRLRVGPAGGGEAGRRAAAARLLEGPRWLPPGPSLRGGRPPSSERESTRGHSQRGRVLAGVPGPAGRNVGRSARLPRPGRGAGAGKAGAGRGGAAPRSAERRAGRREGRGETRGARGSRDLPAGLRGKVRAGAGLRRQARPGGPGSPPSALRPGARASARLRSPHPSCGARSGPAQASPKAQSSPNQVALGRRRTVAAAHLPPTLGSLSLAFTSLRPRRPTGASSP